MALRALHQKLADLMKSMFDEGLLDEQFQQLRMLDDSNDPTFVTEVITMFLADTEKNLNLMENLVNQTVVDYLKLGAYIHQMKGSSSSVGAYNVTQVCIPFRDVCEENDQEGCKKALHVIKHEYLHIRSKLETMLQLEQQIRSYDANQEK